MIILLYERKKKIKSRVWRQKNPVSPYSFPKNLAVSLSPPSSCLDFVDHVYYLISDRIVESVCPNKRNGEIADTSPSVTLVSRVSSSNFSLYYLFRPIAMETTTTIAAIATPPSLSRTTCGSLLKELQVFFYLSFIYTIVLTAILTLI